MEITESAFNKWSVCVHVCARVYVRLHALTYVYVFLCTKYKIICKWSGERCGTLYIMWNLFCLKKRGIRIYICNCFICMNGSGRTHRPEE